MTETLRTEADAVAELAQKPFIEYINGTPLLISPEANWRHTELDSLLERPNRKSGKVVAHDVASFIKLTGRFETANSLVYLDVDYGNNRVKAVAVINDNGNVPSDTGWRDHRIVFEPRFSEEWKRWTKANAQPMSQADLARFLEANLSDIHQIDKTPSAAEVLTFVTQLTETRKVKYGSAMNLQNGMVQIEFVEEGDDHTKGKLEVFKEFGLGLRPFFGGEGFKLKAFLRYRIDRNSGEIKFWFDLQRPDLILEEATKGLIKQIGEEVASAVIYGTPE